MRILIFSDNHGDKENPERIIRINQPLDRIFSLGDSEMKLEKLNSLGVVGVKGNFPFEPKLPLELEFELEGFKFLLVHGHLYNVKLGLNRLLQKGYYGQYDVVCFGHTHRTYLEETSGVILLNPGSLSNWRSRENPTYSLIEINDKVMKITIYNVFGNIIKQIQKHR